MKLRNLVEFIALLCAVADATHVLDTRPIEDEAQKLSRVHKFVQSTDLRGKVLNSTKRVASVLAAQAEDLTQLGHFEEAIALLQKAEQAAGGSFDVVAILLRQRARTLVCRGAAGALEALRTYRRARTVERENGKSDGLPDDPWLEMDLLKRVIHLGQQHQDGAPPPAVMNSLKAQLDRIVEALVSAGPWVNRMQLPRSFVPGLRSQAWHSGPAGQAVGGSSRHAHAWMWTSYPALEPWVHAIMARTRALRDEFLSLASRGLLEEERECIHAAASSPTPRIRPSTWSSDVALALADHERGNGSRTGTMAVRTAAQGGTIEVEGEEAKHGLLAVVPPRSWKAYIANAHWHDSYKLDKEGCNAEDAPEACALATELRSLLPSPRVLRVSYSALGPGAYLHPHYGQSNVQLKFHLGLIVPCASEGGGQGACSDPCALMRVGSESRPWEQGGVSFFDDSFEHSVRNECDKPRVVLQVMFGHPDIPPGKG